MGFDVVGPLLVDLLALLSLSWPSDALPFIWAVMRLILKLVSLILLRSYRVSPALSLRFVLLLMSRSSCSCSINCLRQNVSSLRRGSKICTITWPSGVFSGLLPKLH